MDQQSANRFDIPDALRLESAPGGLAHATISTLAAEASIYLQGAHVAHWTPRGQRPVLFLSPRSLFVTGKAIRGGVPIIFPWFGARSDGKPGPQHGFARTTDWTLEETRLRDDGGVEIALALHPSDTTRGLGYDAFETRLRVTIGRELEMQMETHNTASEPVTYEQAFHSYFAIGDIRQVSVSGLEGTTYIDKTDGFKHKKLGNEPLRIAKETDQVHLNTEATCVIQDPAWQRRIIIGKAGSHSTVVWNPWIEKTKELSDMEPDGWRGMLCVETANASDNALHLEPGGSHILAVSIRVE
jgi:glucose-6-phosphate 1-epimerase